MINFEKALRRKTKTGQTIRDHEKDTNLDKVSREELRKWHLSEGATVTEWTTLLQKGRRFKSREPEVGQSGHSAERQGGGPGAGTGANCSWPAQSTEWEH